MDSTSRREVSVLDTLKTASGRNNGKFCIVIYYIILGECGLGSSVSIATDYGLDGPESNPGEDEIFHLSRPNLPTHPPVQWVPGLSEG